MQLYGIYLIINHSFEESSKLIGGLVTVVGVGILSLGIWSIVRAGLVKLALMKKEGLKGGKSGKDGKSVELETRNTSI